MKATTSPRIPGLILIALALLLAGGCFQLETLVKIHEDGSAIITERFQLSRRLLEFDNSAAGSVLASELTKEAVLERMKLMGKGISLVSHEVRDGEGGGKESVSVFQMPDVSEFQYASPYVGLPGYSGQCMMKCQVAPRLKDGALMTVTFVPVVTDAAKAKVGRRRSTRRIHPRALRRQISRCFASCNRWFGTCCRAFTSSLRSRATPLPLHRGAGQGSAIRARTLTGTI